VKKPRGLADRSFIETLNDYKWS